MSGWGCPHEINDRCTRVNDLPCDPGMKGCVLYGRYRFAKDEKNERWLKKQTELAGDREQNSSDTAGSNKSEAD